MKLLTTIQPRRDGTVIVEGPAPKGLGRQAKKYLFTPDDDGVLVCEIDDEPTLLMLLASGNFEPVDEADLDAAESLLAGAVDRRTQFRQSVAQVKARQAEGDGEGEGGDDDDDDGPDYDGNSGADVGGGALPIEANTPPKPGRKKAAPAEA